jgi:hypothetical protein
MPYFYKKDGTNDVNLLFIHVPKTGGTSFENYLSKKYKIPLNQSTLFSYDPKEVASLQHLVSRDILKRSQEFSIHLENLRIIAVVRNPYDRMISELFYIKLINENSTPEEVFHKINEFFTNDHNYDNHKLPQYEFVIDGHGNINPNIEIAHFENMKRDFTQFGFPDFAETEFANVNKIKIGKKNNEIDYSKYLNNESISLINNYYDKDFTLFGYKKIHSVDYHENFTNISNNSSQFTNIFLFSFILLLILYYFQFFRKKLFKHKHKK